jgi:hypothetical protein
MGALVTLQLPDGSPVLDLPWIITFGPLGDDEDWEPVVSGPYERAHALALAESVVADDDLMAVVEPLLPHVSAEEIRGEIAAARIAVEDEAEVVEEVDGSPYEDELLAEEDVEEDGPAPEPPSPEEVRAGMARIAARLTQA